MSLAAGASSEASPKRWKHEMNERHANAGGVILGILGCLGCLLLAAYFALMGLFNYVGRNIELFYVRYLEIKGISTRALSEWSAWRSCGGRNPYGSSASRSPRQK